MGTSKGYQAPTTPQWGKQKGDVTRASRNGAVSQEVARDIVRGYIQANGGSETEIHERLIRVRIVKNHVS